MNTATSRSTGFSLVELMVAITIGLIVLGAVSAVLVSSKNTYSNQDRLARVQENGRFAIQFLTRDIRLAGYTGCLDEVIAGESFTNTLKGTNSIFNAAISLEGLEADAGVTSSWYPSGDTTRPANVLANTDSLTVKMLDPTTAVDIASEMPNESAEINVSSTSGFKANEIVMVTDCASADLMQITAVQTASSKLQHSPAGGNPVPTDPDYPGNATQKLTKAYGTSAKVMKFTSRRYYIAPGTSGNPALFRADNGQPGVEMVEGIENIQVTYGEDTNAPPDGIPNIYRTAASVVNWDKVMSVRIGVLARTTNQEDADVDTSTYVVNEKSFTPPAGDRHKRRVFLATVVLRNRQ